MNEFSPLQRTSFVYNSPQRGVIHMERPSGIRAAAVEEAKLHERIQALNSKIKDRSRTNNLASRETQESSIFSKIAKRNLGRKETVKWE